MTTYTNFIPDAFESQPLTAQQVQAMKQARAICIRSYYNHSNEFVTEIECRKPYTKAEIARDPYLQQGDDKLFVFRVRSNLDNPIHRRKYPESQAFVSLYNETDSTMGSLTHHIIRKGDVLTVHWYANNSSEWMKKIGATEDGVDLDITRNHKHDSQKMRFRLQTAISDTSFDRNSGRMVRGIHDGTYFSI